MDYSSLMSGSLFGQDVIQPISDSLGVSVGTVIVILAIIMIWELCWKLAGMWKSAKRNSPVWFVVMALFNTLGILPILYIFWFSEIGKKQKIQKKKPAKRKR